MKPITDQRKGVTVALKTVQVKREIHVTAERIAKVMFADAKPPDPSKRIIKKPRAR